MQAQEYARLDRAEGRLWWFRALRLFLRRLLPAVQRGRRAFDIGCGTGGLLRELAADYETVGIDLSAIALDFASQRLAGGLAQASANQLPFCSEAFDLVTCVDLLEVASVQPELLVAEALRVLKPGGHGLFVMAAHQWLLSEHDRAVNSVRRYNLGQLQTLFIRPGIEIKRATYLFFLLFPFIALRKLLNRPRDPVLPSISDVNIPPAIVNTSLLAICWLEAKLLGFINFPMGSSALIVVEKIA